MAGKCRARSTTGVHYGGNRCWLVSLATVAVEINYTPDGDFLLENYVTPVQMENASQQKLETDAISINPNLTPQVLGVIIFLDANEYEVFLKRKEESVSQKLDKTGQLDNPFREEAFGLELRIPRQENPSLDVNYGFEFGDVLAFKTDYDPQGDVVLTRTWSANLGNGNATVNSRLGPKAEFETGDWFIFFTDPNYYELRDTSNEPSYHPNGVKIRGKINETIFLSHLGFELIVTASSEEFGFGDKIKFSTARVATITTEVTELTQFALMRSTDTEPPIFEFWVDGLQPQTGSVIGPRPEIAILLQDANGIDTEFLYYGQAKGMVVLLNLLPTTNSVHKAAFKRYRLITDRYSSRASILSTLVHKISTGTLSAVMKVSSVTGFLSLKPLISRPRLLTSKSVRSQTKRLMNL